MEYLRQLKTAFIFGALVLGISLLSALKIDVYGWLAAFFSFLTLAVHDAGKKYLDLTNQSETVRHAFGIVVDPLTAIVCTASFFYVCVGEMVWYFWLTALFFGLVTLAIDADKLMTAIKKS